MIYDVSNTQYHVGDTVIVNGSTEVIQRIDYGYADYIVINDVNYTPEEILMNSSKRGSDLSEILDLVGNIKDNILNHLGNVASHPVLDKKVAVFNSLIREANTIYPGCVHVGDYSNTSLESIFKLHIHFPEFEITNSRGESHKIVDLVVRLPLRIKKNGFITRMGSLHGARMTLSLEEAYDGYMHSHLRRKTSELGTFGEFCLGNGPFQEMHSAMYSDTTVDDVILFLINLDHYVKWESVEGVPHMYIKNIMKETSLSPLSLSLHNSICANIMRTRLEQLLIRNDIFSFISTKNEDYLSITDNPSVLSNILLREPDIRDSPSLQCKRKNDGSYVNGRSRNANLSNYYVGRTIKLSPEFVMKTKILDEEDSEEVSNETFVHPVLQEYLRKVIKVKILNKL